MPSIIRSFIVLLLTSFTLVLVPPALATAYTAECSATSLVAEFKKAVTSTSTADTLTLAANCVYVLDSVVNDDTTQGANGLQQMLGTSGALTIYGNGATIQRSTADGTPPFRLIQVEAGTLTIHDLTLANGEAPDGGALWNYSGTVTLNDVTMTGNQATSGGAIFNGGTLRVSNSTINGNSASDKGGGIFNEGTLTLTNSTVSGNHALISGGGIFNGGSATLVQSTIVGNSAGTTGGGLSATTGVSLHNSILANSLTGGDCHQSVNSLVTVTSAALVEDGSCGLTGGNVLDVDPQLGPLANNGGKTATHALLPASLAVNAGGQPPTGLTTDQRGEPRVVGPAADLGAVELQELAPSPPPSVTIEQAAEQTDPTNTQPVLFTVTFSQPVTGFSTAGVNLSASTAPGTLSAQVSETLPSDGTSYRVTVSGMTGDGDIVASINAGAAISAALVPNTASTSSDNAVRYDVTAPDVTITQPAPNSLLATSQPEIRFASSDSSATFQCRVDSGTWAACSSPFTPSALSDGLHTVYVRAADGLGNITSTPASVIFATDTTAPSVNISGDVGGTTNRTPLTMTVRFSEIVTGFDASDLVIGNAGRGALSSTDQQTYTIDITPSMDGEVTVSVPAGVALDAAGNTNLASPARYSVIFDATAPDTILTDTPPAVSRSTTVAFTFGSSEPAASFECSLNNAAFAPCTAPFSVGLLADGAYAFAVRAKDAAGNVDPTPASYVFSVDATVPDIAISAPTHDSLFNSGLVTFSFSSTDSGASFACGIDGEPTTPCISPYTPPAMADGQRTFSVRATDAAGNHSTTASVMIRVDTTAPETALDSAPSGVITISQPAFSFSSPDASASFMCRLDTGDAFACASPFTSAALDDGAHTFSVYAVDGAGNTDPTPASASFTVDANAPETALEVAPAGLSNNNSPVFAFSSPDPSAAFQCKLDDAEFAACTSPYAASNLPDGRHTFSVRAVDTAGNSDPTPSSVLFTVDTTPPTVTALTRADSSPTNRDSVTFIVRFSEAVVGVGSDDLALDADELTGAMISEITGSGDTFNARVATGSGDGTLGLNVRAVATITDLAGNPLSGGDASGEFYTIVRSGPLVEDITANVSGTSIVYTVTFTSAVTGVDASDFTLELSGISATIETVSGEDTIYQVTVSWSGIGTIALQVLDDDSIIDALGNPLGGVGADNGAFTSATHDNRPAPNIPGDDPPAAPQRYTPPPTSTPAPPAPLLTDLDGSTHVGVRARVPDSTFGVFGRVLAMDGQFRVEAAQIGSAEVLSRQVLAAVDVFSLNGNSAAGVQICLRGSGDILFLDAATSPRALSALPVTHQGDMTCAVLPGVGMVVLVAP